jgi:translocation and assembly module TamB
MRRRVLISCLVLCGVVLLLLATIPLWLGVAAKTFASSRGVTFGSYERLGYSRFVVRDVVVKRPGVRVTVTRAEAETPLVWLWHRWTDRPALITAEKWSVEVERTSTPRPATTERGWMPLHQRLQRIAAQLHEWLPRANTGPGLVRWPGGEISVASVVWANRELTTRELAFRNLTADASAKFDPAGDALHVAARTTDGAFAAELDSRGAAVTGHLTVWEQPAQLTANFGPRGWMPAEASVQARNWSVAGDRLKLGELYTAVRGDVQIEWRAGRFVADIVAKGEPVPNKPAPPLEVTLRGNGDGTALLIEKLDVVLPGIVARLSEPVTVERSGRIRESAARFALSADLARQPWFAATGNVDGEVRVVSGGTASPVAEFSLAARDVSAREVSLAAVEARGRLDWPRLEIVTGSIVGGNGERLGWRAGWDFKTKEIIDGSLEGEVRRSSLARWLPAQPEFETVRIRAQASGAIAEVAHSGQLEAAGVKVKGVNPLAFAARWSGRGSVIETVEANAAAGQSRISLAGRVDGTSARLTALRLVQGETEHLRLTEPAVIRWRPQLQLESLRLAGPEGRLSASAAMGETGRIEVAAENLSANWMADFLGNTGPSWKLTLLGLMGKWDRGPMVFTLTAGGALEMGEGRVATVNIAARGDREGVHVDALRATEGSTAVINAQGEVPATFTPGAATLVHLDPNGALALDAAVEPNSAFWERLATMTGVELKDPQASARLAGTWQRPEGKATLRAARIAVDPKRVARPLPTMESLEVQITGDREGVRLDTFSVQVEGQAVQARGRLPVPDGNWAALFKEPLATAQSGADLRIEIPDAEVAVFARFLPAMLAPQGRLQADVQYKSGGLEGFLRLRDAATKPLGPLGVLQEISADIAMSGRKFALRGVTARSGGQPVTLSGIVELPEKGEPRFDLALRGENLPFVRQTGLLLRGDLDLKLQTPATGVPRLSGSVRLRDSLFLADVRALLPKGGGASPSRRPPYFAVETPPVNAWTLAVDITGDEFMRLRTPVFAGVASANFRLTGTLGEPRALGEVTIDQGQVGMPFASFAVTQGSVRLTEADPYEPAIYLRATGRRWGYDLTMEIEGSASQPNVVFTSSPPLDSEQVLLMVMTGAAPSNEVTKSATQRVASIGYFLGKSLLGSLGSDADEPDRWTLSTGEKLSREGKKETYDIEYRLSDRWTLTGERNEFDEYNAGVRWRVFRGESAGQKQVDHARK